ncbi:MAG TPA: LysM domain-containing protein [Planctomycetaceae bacterium]|nr:LysM domain-containing protein [Planctomycetaceae bacterium]
MPRDQKLGLALGILLVGVVAAFFFRHDPLPTPALPELKTAAELDRSIATQSRAPYLEADAAAAQPPQNNITDTAGGDEFPEPQDGAGLVPEPIAGGEDMSLDETTSIASSSAPTPNAPREHLVQRGETLSSIAAKYLGSAQRYEDIYQANTDRLRNPNDVQPGMTLLIPDAVGATKPARETAPAVNDVAKQEPAPAPAAGAKMFVPYRRTPLITTPENSAPREADAKPTNKRRLSVTPPRDGSIIR